MPVDAFEDKNVVAQGLCGKQVKCYDNVQRPCVRAKHEDSRCNPFSDTDPAPEETPKPKTEVHDMGASDALTDFTKRVLEDRREIQRSMDADCFRRAQERGETTFTLVERDISSPRTILFWIMENFNGNTPAPKLRDAFEDALQMLFSKTPKKFPD